MRWFTRREEGDTRPWPVYLFGGRFRTSTLALMVAFVLTWWLYAANQPDIASTPESPTQQVVPPGFVPDPDYTWVPRTNVQEPIRTTTPETTTTTTTTTTEPTETTSPTDTTDPSDTADPSDTTTTGVPSTTVVDPDGAGPLPPTTVTVTTSASSVPPAPALGPQPTTTTIAPPG